MGGWAPPLRIARRTLRRSKGRTLLVAALIAVPVLAASWIGLIDKALSPTGEALARISIGRADALLDVSPYAKLAPQGAAGLAPNQVQPAPGAERPVRDTTRFDPRRLLPAETKVAHALMDAGSIDIRGLQTISSVRLITGDGHNPLTAGTFKLDQGRMPTTPGEVAVSPALANYLGLRERGELKPGASLSSPDDKKFVVVGVARTLQHSGARVVFATPGNPLAKEDPAEPVRYLVDLPDSADPDALIRPLNNKGLALLPRATIAHPLSDQSGGESASTTALLALVIGFGVLEIVLLAGTAVAVGARRQTRELGLVTAAGGTPRDIRRIVLLQGLFAGVIGAGSGVALAIVTAMVSRPLWERMLSVVAVGWQIPWALLVMIAALGVLAALGAAVVPAIAAGRQTPMAALASRFTAAMGSSRLARPAVTGLALGVGCAVSGTAWMAHALQAGKASERVGDDPTGAIALVLLGITGTIIALVWLLPNLVAKVAGLASIMPLSGRLALRDAARHRHRTGPATAAIMMAVAATAATAFAASNAIAADAKGYVPTAQRGDAVLAFDDSGDESVPYSSAMVERVAALLPVKAAYELGSVSRRTTTASDNYVPELMTVGPQDAEDVVGNPLVVVDPAYVARFDSYGKSAASALQSGKVVLRDAKAAPKGWVTITDDESERKNAVSRAAAAIPSQPTTFPLQGESMISFENARRLGTVKVYEVQFELTRKPTGDELAAVAKLLGHEDALTIEKGYQSPARLWLLGLLGTAMVVTLLGVAISVSLSAAEGRSDLATLAAVGAPPRRRRNLAAAQAWVIGQLGCLLGLGVGALFGYTTHAVLASPRFMVPWSEIAGIAIVVPLFAGLLAWLLTRSQLPMAKRVD